MGFPCFPNPVRVDADEDFERFASTHPKDIHNPWPQLVDLDDPGRAWSQPFVRALYIPTTRADSFVDALKSKRLPAIYRVAEIHERAHVFLDTPAKEWARVWLAWTYKMLAELFDGNLQSWSAFVTMNGRFRDTCDRIRLAEELLATAIGFASAQRALAKAPNDGLEQWESDSVAAQEQWLPGFAKLYFGGSPGEPGHGIKRAIQLLTDAGDEFPFGLAARLLTAFLEPLDVSMKLPEAVDGKDRCEKLVAAVRDMETAQQLLSWLTQELKSSNDLHAWRVVLALEAELHHDKQALLMGSLWSLARGRKLPWRMKSTAEANKQVRAFLSWRETPKVFPLARFFPQEVGDTWYIRPLLSNYREHGDLLLTESFRQQLDEGMGIHCPNIGPAATGCACKEDPYWGEGIRRIARWAKEGQFGKGASPSAKGEWIEPLDPCPFLSPY